MSVCSFYTACYYTGDFERAEAWTRAFHQCGILGPAPGPQAFPEAGAVLDRRVRTGSFCAYEPHSDDEVTWRVHP